MDPRIAPIIGTVVLVGFGAVFAFVLPRVITKHSGEPVEGDIPIAKWVRILGIIVMVIGVIQVVASYFL